MSSADAPEGRYPHVVRVVTEEPWAILPSKLAAIVEIVSLRAEGHRLTDDEIAERLAALPQHEPRPRNVPPTVAVLPLYGSLVPRADLFTRMSGGTSMESFGKAFRAAVENPQVTSILIDVDSPGGTVAGTPELAALIYEARGTKPITAIANTFATSGAYWVAAQADEIVASPSAMLGSIGVITVHRSLARALEMEGIDVTLVRSGRFKAESSPFEHLSDEALAHIQEISDEAYEKFVGSIAQARGVTVERVKSDYGEGRVLSADMALNVGMVDRIATFEETVARLLDEGDASTTTARATATSPRHVNVEFVGDASAIGAAIERIKSPGASLSPFTDEAKALHASADALVTRLASLAEVERRRLTAAKRDALSGCPEALRQAADAIDGVLSATDPDKQARTLESEHVHFERLRANV